MPLPRQHISKPLRIARRATNYLLARASPPYSRLIFTSDHENWVLNWEIRQLSRLVSRMGMRLGQPNAVKGVKGQCVFWASQFILRQPESLLPNRNAVAYFHGIPDPRNPEFEQTFENLCRYHERVHRIQVTNSVFREFVLSSGVDPEKVHQITIGIDSGMFSLRDAAQKRQAREICGVPQSAFVIGSIQKDGNGWGEGNTPKLIKGPDVLLDTVSRLKSTIPELFVLVCGPSRGYVISGLERLGVTYKHLPHLNYNKIPHVYNALDVYLVASRDEGGPKAVLESMAVGVPLVTTRVGQAVDLVKDGDNGYMVDVEDVDGLAKATKKVYEGHNLDSIIRNARLTAEANDYKEQEDQWRRFFTGFVNF